MDFPAQRLGTRHHSEQRLRRVAVAALALASTFLLLPELPTQLRSVATPNFVGGFGPRRQTCHRRHKRPAAADDAVFEDLFEDEESEDTAGRAQSFRNSAAPRRVQTAKDTSRSMAEEWGAKLEENDQELEAEQESMYDEADKELGDEPEDQNLDPEVSDSEVDEFLADFSKRPIVFKEEGTVPIDPFGKDASTELDTFRELKTSANRQLIYSRGLPGEQQIVTLRDRLMMLEDYAQDGDWQRARYVMKGIWKKRRLRLPLGRYLWNLMIKAHANANRPKAAESWVLDMLNRIFQPDIYSYNTLLNCYARRGDFLNAEKWLRRMQARGVSPDMYSYGAVTSAYAKVGNLEGTERMVRALMESGCEIDSSNTLPHNSVLKLCAQRGDTDLAVKWYEQMQDDGVNPDSVTFMHMIKSFAKAEDPESAAAWLQRMPEALLQPRRQHFHAVMNAHAQLSDMEGAEVWFRVMQDEGHQPDTCSYNILMSSAAQAGDTQAAENIMARMEEVGVEPDVITFNTIIGAFAEAANATGAKHWLLEAERQDVEPDLKCYNQAIKACARAGDSGTAEQLARRLLRHRLTPDVYTYNTLLSSLAKDGLWGPAEFWVDHLQRAARWRHNEFPLKQIALAYSEVLLAHVSAGNMKAAESWLNQMLGEGVEPTARCYSGLARKYLELGEVNEARKWTDRMTSWSNHRVPDDIRDQIYDDDGNVRIPSGQEVPETAMMQ
eukprot:TRINITY_DN62324_c0_g1_i1.p1 TRINITY_DN62324_c0_g1~~TRINITY_DN62324_c0_g1_i1.p1  ORF type:complete len:734 (+),score=156.30 TRINITY_DN62324_c0_g1_i1:34-2202(+)